MESDWLDVRAKLANLFLKAALRTGVFDKNFDPEIRIAEPRFGDFQVNGVLGFAKKQKQNPKKLGELLLAAALEDPALNTRCTLELSGPGFINIRLKAEFLFQWLQQFVGRCELNTLAGKTVVIDYSSPNTAKEMHVGHLRSMIIGESIQRLLRFAGAKVIRDNHLGDWGTQFGILIMAVKRAHLDITRLGADALETFERLYREGVALTQRDEQALEQARQELVKLQQGDSENLAIWQKINEASYRSFDKIYRQMGVAFDYVLGESFYRDRVDRIYTELQAVGLAEENEGALVIFHREHERFKEQPFLIRKSDGASNYATTDLAAVLYRVEEFHADEIIYVTDGRQQDHFQQLFLSVEKWFQKQHRPVPVLKHVWFGTVLGEDGRAIKTRSGDPVKLRQLMEEAIHWAYAMVDEKNPELAESEKQEIARVVGLSAIKYADLSQNRTNDYVFSWQKMLAPEGNTAPYLLYAVARLNALFRKLGVAPKQPSIGAITTSEERALACQIIAFPSVVRQAIDDLRPHYLCTYLYNLASEFSSFYNANRILGEADTVRNTRLLLCQFTRYILKTGLSLLGIETIEKM